MDVQVTNTPTVNSPTGAALGPQVIASMPAANATGARFTKSVPIYAAPTAGIAAGATASTRFLVGGGAAGLGLRASKGSIGVPTAWVTCTANFKAQIASGAAFRDLYTKAGAQAQIPSVVAGRVYELPDACLVGVYALKVIKSTKQTTTAGACTLAIQLRD